MSYNEVVRLLQEAVFDEDCWPKVAVSVDRACETIDNQLSVVPYEDATGFVCFFQSPPTRGVPREEVILEYVERYMDRDERVLRMKEMTPGRPYHNKELWTDGERRTSPMYRDFLPRVSSNDQLSVRLDGCGETHIYWTLSREMEVGGWSFENVERIKHLLPHVAHFVRVRQALASADVRGDDFAALLERTGPGVLFLDRRGRVLEASARARRVLAEGYCLTQREGQLRACSRCDDRKLGQLLAVCCDSGVGGSISLGGTGDATIGSLILLASPVPPERVGIDVRGVAAQILLIEPRETPDIDADHLADIYGLTPAESRLVRSLAQGRTVAEVAAATGRKESTVRWHARNLHSKLGVHRQADLVRLVLATAGAAAPAGPKGRLCPVRRRIWPKRRS